MVLSKKYFLLASLALSLNCFGQDSSMDETKVYHKLKTTLNSIQSSQIKITPLLVEELEQTFTLSEDFEIDSDIYDFDELLDIFEYEVTKWKKSQFKLNYFAILSLYTWNYSILLTDSDGTNVPLYSKERGSCIGGGFRYQNAEWGIESTACYARLTATIGEDSKEKKFNQSSVAVDALTFTTSLLWRPKERVSLKAGVPIIYHKGKYSPSVGGKITDSNEMSLGYLIASEWSFEKIAFEIAFGSIRNYPSSFWALKLAYHF